MPRLPDGAGNMTPGAEFNFWVDPDAAKIVLRSGVPIELSPLNVSRKSSFDRQAYERLVAKDTTVTRLIRETAGPLFDEDPDRVVHMYDQIAVASLIDPSLVTTTSSTSTSMPSPASATARRSVRRPSGPAPREPRDGRAVRPRLDPLHRPFHRAGLSTGRSRPGALLSMTKSSRIAVVGSANIDLTDLQRQIPSRR